MEIAIESGWQSPSPLPSPTVDVVLIVRDLKPWFEEVLSGLATQDYRNFKIFVINAAEESKREAIALKVFSQLPSAQIVNYSGFSTFSEAVNSVTEHKDFDSYGHFYLLLHEDLVLNATALRRMAEAALDANAGIVGLKVLSGEDPNHLEDMGTSIDRLGSPVPVVELGEIDQGQHDFQQNFFAVSEAAMLIRVDLFVALGGFDLSIREPDSHVDLCWRARLVGAATLLVPKAVGYRFRNSSLREIASSSHNLRPRQRLRMMLTNTSGFKTFTVLFESVFVTVLGVLYGFLTGRFRLVWGHISAWVWNIWKLKEIRINRSRIARLTEGRSIFSLSDTWLPHHALRRAITGRAPRGSRAEAPARIRFHQLLGALLGSGGILLLTCGGVIGFGSRHLLAQGLPAVGRFQMFPSDPLDLFRSWWHGWRSTGMGVDIPGPDGLSLLGLFAALVPGSDQLILTLVVLAAFPVGAIGLWLLVRPIGGGRSRAVAVVVYLAFPLPYDALREGRLTPLIGYALIPWLARYLVSAQGGFSFGSVNGHSRTTVLQSSLLGNALMVGLLIAIGVAFDPIVVVPILTVFAGLVLGNAMTGNLIGLKRLSLVALGGFIVALLIHLPLAVQILNSGSITFLFEPNVWPVGDLGTSGIFNLDTGSFRNDAFGWVFFVVPMMVFFVTARRHLVLGICAWFVIAAGLCGVWMFDQGWWTGRIPNPETLFLPVILGLAWATAVSVAAIGEDLSTRVAIWRRLLIPVAGLALIVNVTPVLLSSFEGSWGAPKKGLFEAVNFIFDSRSSSGETTRGGDNRVVWIGDPSLLPTAGVPLTDKTALAITDGWPDLGDQWSYPLKEASGVVQVRSAFERAFLGKTSRLGSDVGHWGIKHIVLVERSAPVPEPSVEVALPAFYFAALTRQLDLTRVEGINRAVTVFENTSSEPVYAVVRDRNQRAVPALTTVLGWDRRALSAITDGSLRWSIEPADSWNIDGVGTGVVSPGSEEGFTEGSSVRIATGTTAYLAYDSSSFPARRRLQIALFFLALLAANWIRIRYERDYK